MMQIKIEYDCLKAAKTSALGLMFEVTAPESPADETPKAREPKGIVFVIDRSGSMGGGRLELVKQTITDMLPRLGQGDYLSVVTFDNQARVELPLTQIKDAKLSELRETIGAIRTGGNTNLEAGYRHGLAEAAKAPDGVESTVVLLSDGQANSGTTDPVLLGQLAAAATEHLVTTSTLGIGEGYDESILDAMSVSGSGNHFAAYRLEEAVDGLSDELDGLLKKTIANLKVEIIGLGSFGTDQFKVRKVNYLRDFKSFEGYATANLGDLASKEEKNFVFEVTLPGIETSDNLKLEVLEIKYEYEDLIMGRLVKGGQRFELEVKTENDYIEPARDEDIVAELQALRFEDMKEQAIQLMRDGRETEARELLKQAGDRFEGLLENLSEMSHRQRARLTAQQREFRNLSSLDDNAEFMKRGTESVNRRRRSKEDPRSPKDFLGGQEEL
jgi:Ca-activated chloride channel family protein